MSMEQKHIEGLVARGERLVKTTHKYKVYTRAKGGFYYVGRSGAVRVGSTVQSSIPCSDAFKASLRGEVWQGLGA